MKTNILKTATIFLLLGLFTSCEKERGANDPIHFTVFGTVYNTTGDPVNGAEITLYYGTHTSGVGSSNPTGAAGSSVSGLDGQFSIPCIATDNLISEKQHRYQIEASSSGYKEYSKKLTIMETEGVQIKSDILLHYYNW